MKFKLHKEIDSLPLFFIISRPRSGSTLLRIMFDANPEIAIPMECPMIIALYKKYSKIKVWDIDFVIRLFNDLKNIWKIDSLLLDYEELKNDLISYNGNKSFQVLYKIINLNYFTVFEKSVIQIIGDKNPSYSIYVKRLMEIFPDARFIHLVRDYRDNILSVRKYDFESPFIALLAYRWRFVVRQTDKLLKNKSEYAYTLRYEDLVKNPDEKLKELCSFLDIVYDELMLKFYDKKEEIINNFDSTEAEKYFSNLFLPVNTENIGKWKTNFSDSEIKTAELVAGKLALKYGYPRKHNKFSILLRIKIIPAIIYGYLWIQMKYLYDKLPNRLRNRLNYPTLFAGLYYSVFKKKKSKKLNHIN